MQQLPGPLFNPRLEKIKNKHPEKIPYILGNGTFKPNLEK